MIITQGYGESTGGETVYQTAVNVDVEIEDLDISVNIDDLTVEVEVNDPEIDIEIDCD